MNDTFYYTFPAIRGIQAGMEYYTSMCYLKLIPKLFIFNEEEVSPEIRSQRVLNKSRIPEMSSYIIDNKDSYVFSALTSSIDGEIDFIPLNEKDFFNVGRIKIPMSAKFVINDGQHRRAAIEEALKKDPSLGNESIAIVFYVDLGLKRCQQMFSDLNKYAIRPTKSLNILYDNRNEFSLLVKEVTEKVPIFKGFVETEKTTISNRSKAMFTLSGIYNGTKELLSNIDNIDLDSKTKFAIDYWKKVSDNTKEWQMVRAKEISSAELRRNYINGHTVALNALGSVGNELVKTYPSNWKSKMKNLKKIDWNKETNKEWDGKVLIGGKISGTRGSMQEASKYLKNIVFSD